MMALVVACATCDTYLGVHLLESESSDVLDGSRGSQLELDTLE